MIMDPRGFRIRKYEQEYDIKPLKSYMTIEYNTGMYPCDLSYSLNDNKLCIKEIRHPEIIRDFF